MWRFRLIVCLSILAVAAQAASASDAPLPVCEFSSLNLEIASTKVVSAISNGNQTVTPKAGKKIVVVRLKAGNLTPKDCEWMSDLLDIEAVYQVPASTKKQIPYKIVPAAAIKIAALMGGRDMWYFPEQQSGVSISSLSINDVAIMDGGVLRLQNLESADIAFILPEDVMNFTVRHPASIPGIASLGPDKVVVPQASPATNTVPSSRPIAASGQAAVQVLLVIDSVPTGADVEIDGAFVGNTPSTVGVAPGKHQVVVKMKGYADWSKNLNVTGGSIHLSAELEKATQ